MSAEAEQPIIVSGGGSISIEFNQAKFLHVAPNDFQNSAGNITHVTVVANGVTVLDADVKDGDATITIDYA